MSAQDRYEAGLDLLARSAFAVCFLMLVSGLATFPLLLLHRSSHPQFLIWTLRYTIFLVTYLGLLAVLFWVCRWLYLLDRETLRARMARVLRPPIAHLASGTVVAASLSAAVAVLLLLNNRPPSLHIYVGVGMVLLWVFILLVLIAAMYWWVFEAVSKALRPWLVGIGVVVVFVVGAEASLRLYDRVAGGFGASGDLVGPAGVRFVGDGDHPWAGAYWQEFLESKKTHWAPYIYWRRKPYQGEFINIDERGVRETPPPPGPPERQVYVFGGSTVWGTGARDDHTIPAELVTAFSGNGINAEVTNFGETGYVSRQDAILFELQLEAGHVPDLAVFYWGYNDVFSAWQQGYTGLPQNEANRVADFEAGRCELSLAVAFTVLAQDTMLGTRLFEWFDISPVLPERGCNTGGARLEEGNLSLAEYPPDTPEAMSDHVGFMIDRVESLSDDFGVQTLFVWQPMLYLKEPLSEYENGLIDGFEGLGPFYVEVDQAVRRELAGGDNVLILSDFFRGWQETVFIDTAHITEAGNRAVAEDIVQHLVTRADSTQPAPVSALQEMPPPGR